MSESDRKFTQINIDKNYGSINIGTEYSEKSKIPIDKIKEEFSQASHILADYQNFFEGLSTSHIERIETDELYQWVKSPISNTGKSIAMLVGDAGSGKSVILKDLWQRLNDEGITTLGLKADRYYVKSISELEKQIGVGDSLEKMVLSLSTASQAVVIIVDQIDALSLSLSANRAYLNAYKLLVRKLSSIVNVKVVISVRTYDLNYDTELNFLEDGNDNKNQKRVLVRKLTELQVSQVLKKLDAGIGILPGNLIELLKTPLHLNVFAKVYSKTIGMESLNTLQDLYDELWEQKLLNLPHKVEVDTQSCINLLYEIAGGIEISVPSNKFKEVYFKELQYLNSVQIVIENGNVLQFFHQTFFDYVFAKRFVESQGSVYDLLADNKQGLLIRSRLKMIINYLRIYDQGRYLNVMKRLLKDKNTRFHIKHLLISLLGYRNDPNFDEIEFAYSNLLNSKGYKRLFYEMAFGNGWLHAFINKGDLDRLLFIEENWVDKIQESSLIRKWTKKLFTQYIPLSDRVNNSRQIWVRLLWRKLPNMRQEILVYLIDTPDFEGKADKIANLLYRLKVWDNPLAKQLFERQSDYIKKDSLTFTKIIEDAAHYDFDWATKIYRDELSKSIKELSHESRGDFLFSHDEESLLKQLFIISGEKAFYFYFNILNEIIKGSKLINKDKTISLYDDSAFFLYPFNSLRNTYKY